MIDELADPAATAIRDPCILGKGRIRHRYAGVTPAVRPDPDGGLRRSTRAALLPCVGGPFFPGIEMTYIASDKTFYAGPFRLDPALPPGAITRWMAVPW